MEYQGAPVKASVFLSCSKQTHYSREVILSQHALVHVFDGELRVHNGTAEKIYHSGATVLIPRNYLCRLTKYPMDGKPFKSISVLFPEEQIRKHFEPFSGKKPAGHLAITTHPLLESLFGSLLPYFSMHEELPADLAMIKIDETLTILKKVDKQTSEVLATFDEPGKIDLGEYMEQHFMYNLPLEKFGHLTGRSLTTFKKDFKHIYQTTPGKWLTQKRLELAHYQIFVQKRKVSDVYLDAGFENLSHFSFAFKKQYGYNPTTHK
jgi:AraC-like DNA-binding protein